MVKNLKEKELVKKSKFLRLEFIKLLYKGFKFHIGGTLSCLDLMTVLFYNKFVNYFKDTYQHGGISMEEMLCPIIRLSPK